MLAEIHYYSEKCDSTTGLRSSRSGSLWMNSCLQTTGAAAEAEGGASLLSHSCRTGPEHWLQWAGGRHLRLKVPLSRFSLYLIWLSSEKLHFFIHLCSWMWAHMSWCMWRSEDSFQGQFSTSAHWSQGFELWSSGLATNAFPTKAILPALSGQFEGSFLLFVLLSPSCLKPKFIGHQLGPDWLNENTERKEDPLENTVQAWALCRHVTCQKFLPILGAAVVLTAWCLVPGAWCFPQEFVS